MQTKLTFSAFSWALFIIVYFYNPDDVTTVQIWNRTTFLTRNLKPGDDKWMHADGRAQKIKAVFFSAFALLSLQDCPSEFRNAIMHVKTQGDRNWTVCLYVLETYRKDLRDYRVNLDVKTGGGMRTKGNAWAIDLELGNMMKNNWESRGGLWALL